MRDYIIRRLLILVPVMIGVSLLTFSLFNVIPGDACVLRLGFGSTDETLLACREQHGLNEPLFPISINSDPLFDPRRQQSIWRLANRHRCAPGPWPVTGRGWSTSVYGTPTQAADHH